MNLACPPADILGPHTDILGPLTDIIRPLTDTGVSFGSVLAFNREKKGSDEGQTKAVWFGEDTRGQVCTLPRKHVRSFSYARGTPVEHVLMSEASLHSVRQRGSRVSSSGTLQGYLARQKQRPPRALQ